MAETIEQLIAAGTAVPRDGILLIKVPANSIKAMSAAAREIAAHCPEGPKIVVCPESLDVKALPRADAVRWLKEVAAELGCHVSDPEETVVFPKLSPEETAEMIRNIKSLGAGCDHVEPIDPKWVTFETTEPMEAASEPTG